MSSKRSRESTLASLRCYIPNEPVYSLSSYDAGGELGTGLKTNDNIPANVFVIEYKGEVISIDEAHKREHQLEDTNHTSTSYMFYCQSGRTKIWYVCMFIIHLLIITFLMLIECLLCVRSIDATVDRDDEYGLARLMNHSAINHNLKGYLIPDPETKQLRLCFLSTRNIFKDEPLLIDYGDRRRDVTEQLDWLKQ
jgi:SET domain-containing protein